MSEKSFPDAPGLRLKMHGNDRTGSWSVLGRIHGKRSRVTFADFPSTSEAKAKTLAGAVRVEMRQGIDRNAQKREAAAAVAAQRTMDEQAVDYLDTLKPGTDHRETESWALKAIISEMKAGRLAPSMVSDTMIDAALDREARPATRRHKYEALKRLMKRLRKTKVIATTPFDTVDPVAKAKPRDRHYNATEVAAVWSVLDQLPDPYGDLFRVLMLVPLRRQEASLITGEMIDLEQGVLRLPQEITKTDTEFEIMLPTAALEIFAGRPREGWVFPSGKTGEPVKNWDDTLSKIRRLSGVRDFRPHDMRRTFATEAAELGVTFEVCDACLNHAQSASKNMVTRAYQLAGLEGQKRRAMETWAAALDRAITTGSFEGEGNVTRLKTA